MNCSSGASREVIRVLVADSSEPQSQRLSSALDRQSGFHVASSLQERSETLRVLQDAPADTLLLGDGPADLEGLIANSAYLHANHADVGLILLLNTHERISTHKEDAEFGSKKNLQHHFRAPLQGMRVHDSNSTNLLED